MICFLRCRLENNTNKKFCKRQPKQSLSNSNRHQLKKLINTWDETKTKTIQNTAINQIEVCLWNRLLAYFFLSVDFGIKEIIWYRILYIFHRLADIFHYYIFISYLSWTQFLEFEQCLMPILIPLIQQKVEKVIHKSVCKKDHNKLTYLRLHDSAPQQGNCFQEFVIWCL